MTVSHEVHFSTLIPAHAGAIKQLTVQKGMKIIQSAVRSSLLTVNIINNIL